MKFNELKVVSQARSTRVGRGISAGRGKTAGRGTKGQGSRKSPVKIGFEGGQTPLTVRIPKLPGFKSRRIQREVVFTSHLAGIKSSTIDTLSLADAGIISSPYVPVKLISDGEVSAKKTVKLQAASRVAAEAIKKAGGSFEKVGRLPRPKSQGKT